MKTITLTVEQLSELLKSKLKAGIGIGMLSEKYGLSVKGIEDAVTQESIHILTKSKFTPPFRVGRKTKRAILDANGLEYVVFKEGLEVEAQDFCNYLNKKNQ
jgi:hypothetical protein